MRLNKKYFTADWWTTKTALILRDEDNFAEKRKFVYTPARVVTLVFLAFLMAFCIGFWVASKVYNRTLLTGQDAETARKLIALNLTVDSLAKAIQERDNYIQGFKKAIIGEITAKYDKTATAIDTGKSALKITGDSVNIDQLSAADIKLREEMERNPAVYAQFSSTRNDRLRDIFLFPPLKGIISNQYDARTSHLGIDIVSSKDEPIKSVSEGTVIMASWTDDTGYVITIQHQSDLISVYKHCSVLLKKTGDFVRAGEIIAIIGNSGELTTGPHLHFELWYKGNPTNPEELISF